MLRRLPIAYLASDWTSLVLVTTGHLVADAAARLVPRSTVGGREGSEDFDGSRDDTFSLPPALEAAV